MYFYIYIYSIYTPGLRKKKYTGECHKDSAQDLRCWIVKWTKFRVGGPNLRRCWWISWCSSSPPCFAVWMPLVHSKSMPRRRWLDWPSFWGRSFRRFPVAPRATSYHDLSSFRLFGRVKREKKNERLSTKRHWVDLSSSTLGPLSREFPEWSSVHEDWLSHWTPFPFVEIGTKCQMEIRLSKVIFPQHLLP